MTHQQPYQTVGGALVCRQRLDLDFFSSLHFRFIVCAVSLATSSEFSMVEIGGNAAITNPETRNYFPYHL